MAGTVPVAASLSSIYTPDVLRVQKSRWSSLLGQFESTFSGPATFVSRSPGRVNIIGEHIDYSLYGVLPMAIAADALLAVSAIPTSSSSGEAAFELANLKAERFPQRSFVLAEANDWDVEIDASVLEWTNYFKSGLRGALELLRQKKGDGFVPVGMKVLMDGTVPVGGGLSSSAAFVSASALAVLYVNGVTEVDKTELTELAIVSERAVGVNSGGMDQSASVLSLAGSALHVDFVPTLKATPVKMPETDPELVVLIAQSFVSADKHVMGPIHYNLRVVECSLAAAFLDAGVNGGGGLPKDSSPLEVSLRGFHLKYFSGKEKDPMEELKELLALADKTLIKDGYTREEIAEKLGTSVLELEKTFMSRFPVRADKFKLRQRAMHVFTEAVRVLQFLELLKTSPPGCEKELGRLMNETQDSCRDLYECSCPELDEICAIARRNGSLGSRLTGAGWGGCSVHLVPGDKVQSVKEAWDKEYYAKMALSREQRGAAVVASKPGSGSMLFLVKEGSLE
ncbi:hypothetical protein MKZ38_004815 [Zalerion maritima]|uniref:Galactokinase n=1 Tax=Zalerion maritima TaxID=339359 RepID=A0AAD5WQP3_9PEZI|nr:hypothetical protein MKZ38_004815 [Zalerion maritima]